MKKKEGQSRTWCAVAISLFFAVSAVWAEGSPGQQGQPLPPFSDKQISEINLAMQILQDHPKDQPQAYVGYFEEEISEYRTKQAQATIIEHFWRLLRLNGGQAFVDTVLRYSRAEFNQYKALSPEGRVCLEKLASVAQPPTDFWFIGRNNGYPSAAFWEAYRATVYVIGEYKDLAHVEGTLRPRLGKSNSKNSGQMELPELVRAEVIGDPVEPAKTSTQFDRELHKETERLKQLKVDLEHTALSKDKRQPFPVVEITFDKDAQPSQRRGFVYVTAPAHEGYELILPRMLSGEMSIADMKGHFAIARIALRDLPRFSRIQSMRTLGTAEVKSLVDQVDRSNVEAVKDLWYLVEVKLNLAEAVTSSEDVINGWYDLQKELAGKFPAKEPVSNGAKKHVTFTVSAKDHIGMLNVGGSNGKEVSEAQVEAPKQLEQSAPQTAAETKVVGFTPPAAYEKPFELKPAMAQGQIGFTSGSSKSVVETKSAPSSGYRGTQIGFTTDRSAKPIEPRPTLPSQAEQFVKSGAFFAAQMMGADAVIAFSKGGIKHFSDWSSMQELSTIVRNSVVTYTALTIGGHIGETIVIKANPKLKLPRGLPNLTTTNSLQSRVIPLWTALMAANLVHSGQEVLAGRQKFGDAARKMAIDSALGVPTVLSAHAMATGTMKILGPITGKAAIFALGKVPGIGTQLVSFATPFGPLLGAYAQGVLEFTLLQTFGAFQAREQHAFIKKEVQKFAVKQMARLASAYFSKETDPKYADKQFELHDKFRNAYAAVVDSLGFEQSRIPQECQRELDAIHANSTHYTSKEVDSMKRALRNKCKERMDAQEKVYAKSRPQKLEKPGLMPLPSSREIVGINAVDQADYFPKLEAYMQNFKQDAALAPGYMAHMMDDLFVGTAKQMAYSN
jgi:hypothetical protein